MDDFFELVDAELLTLLGFETFNEWMSEETQCRLWQDSLLLMELL